MTKRQAIEMISKAAAVYEENLNNKNLLIIYGNPSVPCYIETKFLPRNFLHLTGVSLNKKIQNNSPARFYKNAVDHKLCEDDFDFKGSTAELKLCVLTNTLRIAENAGMIGDYNGVHLKLHTDKLAGSVNSCLGFVKIWGVFVPNTVLAVDMRKEVRDRQKILAILSKKISSDKYDKIEMTGKKIDISRLLERLEKSVPIADELLHEKEPAGIV